MSDFKATPKMRSDLPCFKEGGSIQQQVKNFTKRDRKQVAEVDAPAKKVVKKAIGMHDEQQHEEKTDLSGLKKGGRAKKEKGTVRKFKVGGSVDNEYSAKKASGDLDRIAKVKDIKPGKAAAPSKASVKPNFRGSDVEKEKSKPAGEKDKIKKVKPTGDKKADAPNKAAIKPSRLKDKDAVDDINGYKTGRGVKKYAVGGNVLQDLMQAKEIARLANARKYLGKGQQGQFAASEMQQTPTMTGMGQQASAPAQAAMPQTDQMGNATGIPAQKRGGKVKKMNTGGTCP
jgi:hypothetical protein